MLNWRTALLVQGLLASAITAAAAADSLTGTGAAQSMSRYNVVWASPSKDATGVMPIGNGDIAAGVYVIEDGDLYLLLAKNDAYNSSGEIYKTGRVRVALAPNPFHRGKPFRQTLDLATGSIRVQADGVMLRHLGGCQSSALSRGNRRTGRSRSRPSRNSGLARTVPVTCGYIATARFCGTSRLATRASIRMT